MTIAALFVETGGCYFNQPGIDPWDIHRDARLYPGPHPVIAHPPCERWGRFAEGSPMKRGYVLGDDGGCFRAALSSLARWGGVLEHPAHSKAWDAYGIRKPEKSGWVYDDHHGLWVCEVEQGHYGHPARKKTWLLAGGGWRGMLKPPADLIWGPCEQRLPAKRLAERGYESARRCGIIANMCSKHRQRTPPRIPHDPDSHRRPVRPVPGFGLILSTRRNPGTHLKGKP
jgi:hypothetical protein